MSIERDRLDCTLQSLLLSRLTEIKICPLVDKFQISLDTCDRTQAISPAKLKLCSIELFATMVLNVTKIEFQQLSEFYFLKKSHNFRCLATMFIPSGTCASAADCCMDITRIHKKISVMQLTIRDRKYRFNNIFQELLLRSHSSSTQCRSSELQPPFLLKKTHPLL
jgi:hypothetical protein